MKNYEFIYTNEMERQAGEVSAIKSLISNHLDDVAECDRIENHKKYGDVFNRIIAFKLEYQLIPPYQDDNYNVIKMATERITLKPVEIQKRIVEMPISICCKKLNFKERIKALFTGIVKF